MDTHSAGWLSRLFGGGKATHREAWLYHLLRREAETVLGLRRQPRGDNRTVLGVVGDLPG